MKQSEQMAEALAQAFFNDPLFGHFFPGASSRHRLSLYTFRFLVAHARARGRITVAEGDGPPLGAALWLPSERTERGLRDQLRFGALSMVVRQGPAAIARQILASSHMGKLHRDLMGSPHYYLSVLGLKPEGQGRGLATPMLTPMLERADREGRACYLDTHSEANLNLYRRFGFEVRHEGRMPGSAVCHWVMVRPPGVPTD